MGTFVGHLVPGLALTLLGLWHIINTIRAYCLRGSSNFTVRFWYPFNGPSSKLKHLELILILSFSVLTIFMQVLDFPFFRFAFKLDNFEHATMFLQLAIFSGFTLSTELTHSFDILSGVPGILAASVFGQELFLLHFHSTDHVGLEGHYHWLLQLIVFFSFVAAIATTSSPSSFCAALALSLSVVFQGFWFMNMAFMLWVPAYAPQGCITQLAETHTGGLHSAVTCKSLEADRRARALANLQFSWIITGILVFTATICLKLARKYAPRCQLTEYERLDGRRGDVPISIAIDELVKANP